MPQLNIISYDDNNGNLQLTTSSEHNYKVNDIVEITSVSEYNNQLFYVKQIIDNNTFILDTQFITGVSSPNGKIRYKQHAPVLYGYNILNPSADGLSIELLNGYINISINNVNYVFATGLAEYEDDTWYSVIINMSNTFNQLTAYLYKLNKPLNFTTPQLQDSSLELIYNETKSLNGPISVNSGDSWALLGSLIDLTNIRIFEIPIEEESHDAVLNQYVVRDTQLALLVDNAIPQIKLMRFENPR